MKLRKSILLLVFLQCCYSFSQEDPTAFNDTLYLPVKHQKSWYFADTLGIIHEEKPHFDDVKPVRLFAEIFYIVKANGKYGVYDHTLASIVPVEYDSILACDDFMLLRQGRNWKQNVFSETMFETEADSIFHTEDYVYYYLNGKVGLVSLNHLICKPVHEKIMPLNESLFLTYDAGKFGLIDQAGKELLQGMTEIQLFDYGMVRFRSSENWQYLVPETGQTIDPQGNDILFYYDQAWKIYNPDRSKAVLYLHSGKEILNTYDDYFLLGNAQVAFRTDGKVGVMDQHQSILIPAQFEQIEYINNQYYQYKQNDLWGLIDKTGKVITPAEYAHFLSVGQQDLFHVLNNGYCGIMNSQGKLVIPISYDYVHVHNDFFILQSGRKYGMADLNGKIIANCDYSGFSTTYSSKTSLRLATFWQNNQISVFSKHGLINPEPCNHYIFENSVLKCYGDHYIDVHVLTSDGKQEDYHRYSNIQSFNINNDFHELRNSHPSSFNKSYLEENQQTGLFGMRYLQQKGMAVKPTFKYVRKTLYAAIYTGKVEIENKLYQPAQYAELQTSEGGLFMFTTDAHIQNDLVVNSEAFSSSLSGSSTWSDMKMSPDFQMRWISGNNRYFSEEDLKSAIFTDYADGYKRVYIGGKAEICALEESDISASDYFSYLNQMRNFWFSNSLSVQTYMDPQLGFRFTGGTWKVFPVKNHVNKPKINFTSDQTFKTFRTTGVTDHYLFEETGSQNLQFADIWNDTTRLDKLVSIESNFGFGREAYQFAQKSNARGKIHVSRPDFIFEADDELTAYAEGLIISQKKGKYGIDKANGDHLVPPIYNNVKYVGNHRFLVQETDFSWKLFTPKNSLSDTARNAYQKELQSIIPDYSCIDCAFHQQYVSVRKDNKTILYDYNGQFADTIGTKETLIGNSFLLSKDKRNAFQVRMVGSSKLIPLKTVQKPELVGNALLIRNGNKYSLLDKNGNFAVKKTEIYEKHSNGTIAFMLSKKWQFFNADGEKTDDSELPAFLMMYDGNRHYFVSSQTENPNGLATRTSQKVVIKDGYGIFQIGQKFGAIDQHQRIVVPCIYESLIYLGNGEFSVPLKNRQNFATSALKPILAPVYEEVFVISSDLYRVRRGDRYGYLRGDGSWLREME